MRTKKGPYLHRTVDGHDIHFDAETSERMGGIRQKDTAPERAVRKVLTEMGLRYRIRNQDLPGSPDIANRRKKWAIFVHGCYWHRHPGCKKATTPKRNTEFWLAKFEANVCRDRKARKALEAAGFCVGIIWECQTEGPAELLRALRRIAGTLMPDRPAQEL